MLSSCRLPICANKSCVRGFFLSSLQSRTFKDWFDIWAKSSVISSFSFLFLLLFVVLKEFIDFLLNLWRVWRSHGVGSELRSCAFIRSSLARILEICEPLHCKNFLEAWSLVAVFFQQSSANFNCGLSHLLPWVECKVRSVLDSLTGDFFIILIIEWKNSTEQQVGDHTE